STSAKGDSSGGRPRRARSSLIDAGYSYTRRHAVARHARSMTSSRCNPTLASTSGDIHFLRAFSISSAHGSLRVSFSYLSCGAPRCDTATSGGVMNRGTGSRLDFSVGTDVAPGCSLEGVVFAATRDVSAGSGGPSLLHLRSRT